MHLIIYGPEGSGKGTQAQLLSEKLAIPIYTSGDLVRQTAKKDRGLLGDACRKALLSGKYVSDKDMFKLWEKKLESRQARKGFILDGFPRNVDQAKFLFSRVNLAGYAIDKVIYLSVTDEEAIKRLIKRKRPLFPGSEITHDTPERIKERLKIYHHQEKDLLDFFEKKRMLVRIDGDQEKIRVLEEILKKLGLDK